MGRPEQGIPEQPGTAGSQETKPGGGTTPPGPQAASAAAETAEWKAKAAENYDLFLRARADYENLARRTQRDASMLVRMGKRDLLLKLLELADNLERAAASWRKALAGCQGVDTDGLVGGVEMIGRQLQSVLASEGVQPIEALGKPFDPTLHECVVTWDSPDFECPTVTDEIKRGYTLNGEVLRASQVRVARP